MRFTEAFLEECLAKVGHSHTLAQPDRAPTFDDFVELYPATTEGRVAAATAAGYGKPGQHKPGTAAHVRRRSFMRQLQRWTTEGTERRKPPDQLRKREAGIVKSSWKKASTPRNLGQVLELIRRYGATVTALIFTPGYEKRKRNFSAFSVGLKPSLLQRCGFTRDAVRGEDMDELAGAFLLAFSRAYGMGDYLAGGQDDDTELLTFRLGFAATAQYQYGRASRPPKAPNVPPGSRKYRGVA